MDEKSNNLEIDSLLGHYRILKKIGAGGMGEVYLAEDGELERQVALKVLPTEFVNDKDAFVVLSKKPKPHQPLIIQTF